MAYSFKGGIHPSPHKSETSHKKIEVLKPPPVVVMPMQMHIGMACEPLVKVGQRVLMGEKIGDSNAFVSAPIHASISGTVVDISKKLHPSGSRVMSVTIENDYQDEAIELTPHRNYDDLSLNEMLAIVRDAGIVGHGGAAFPTHAKLSSAIGKIDTIILNGAECEPYITSDHRVMLEHSGEIVGGARALLKIFGKVDLYIGIEENKKDAIQVMRNAIGDDDRIKVATLLTKYPQGSEKQLIKAITGREVPPGKLPADARCMVTNVDTATSIYRAFEGGMPVIRRVVTVSGSAVAVPKNLHVRIGTQLRYLVEAVGGFREEPQKMIMGGPMMGLSQFSLEVPVIKATNAFLAFSENEDRRVSNPVCIRCGRCIRACPMRLLPTYIYQNAAAGNYEICEKLNVTDCMECGACTFECPGSLHLTQTFRMAKAKVLENKKK